MVVDHLSRILNAPTEIMPINEDFPNEHIFMMCKEPWYANIALQPDEHLQIDQVRTSTAF